MNESEANAVALAAFLAFCALMVVLYFIPTLVALMRGHPNAAPIVVVNVLFGWSLIGWGIALAWSLTAFDSRTPVVVVRQSPPQFIRAPLPPNAIEQAAVEAQCRPKPQKAWRRASGRG